MELDNVFHTVAEQRWANIQTTGQTVPWDDTKAYLAARANGESVRKPFARKLAKCPSALATSWKPSKS